MTRESVDTIRMKCDRCGFKEEFHDVLGMNSFESANDGYGRSDWDTYRDDDWCPKCKESFDEWRANV